MSENESLELSWVTDAHGGAYTLTVNTGKKSLHKTFTISVLRTTTSLHTGELHFLTATSSLCVALTFSIPTGQDLQSNGGPERLNDLINLTGHRSDT